MSFIIIYSLVHQCFAQLYASVHCELMVHVLHQSSTPIKSSTKLTSLLSPLKSLFAISVYTQMVDMELNALLLPDLSGLVHELEGGPIPPAISQDAYLVQIFVATVDPTQTVKGCSSNPCVLKAHPWGIILLVSNLSEYETVRYLVSAILDHLEIPVSPLYPQIPELLRVRSTAMLTQSKNLLSQFRDLNVNLISIADEFETRMSRIEAALSEDALVASHEEIGQLLMEIKRVLYTKSLIPMKTQSIEEMIAIYFSITAPLVFALLSLLIPHIFPNRLSK